MSTIKHITVDPTLELPPTRDIDNHKHTNPLPTKLPSASHTHSHPRPTPSATSKDENASIYFVGTATTILEWGGIRIVTDPNFLHAGDHVHLGPGVTGTRLTNPAIDLHNLPRVDLVLLSHYHADHFDQEVERKLRRDLPIITTPHAKEHLEGKESEEAGEGFTQVHGLDFWESLIVHVKSEGDNAPAVKVTGMPGKHVGDGILSTLNDLVGAVPPTNGWMVELGSSDENKDFKVGYTIYISGDTLLVDELRAIPKKYPNIDLMLAHLGGTTIPSPKLPLLMVTMDARQGLGIMRLMNPDVTIPIHYDDYDVFLSPLDDFKRLVKEEGLEDKVVYLERADEYRFCVKD